MRLLKFEYLEPKTLKETANALASDMKGSVLIAGGTDLLVNMKHRVIQPKQVINLKTIPKLAYILNEKVDKKRLRGEIKEKLKKEGKYLRFVSRDFIIRIQLQT